MATAVESESPMVSFAREELKRAGMWDDDVDYGKGEIAECVLALVKTLSSQGHSGGSIGLTLEVFNRVAQYKPLSPLTSNPEEWMDVSGASGGNPTWQSRRQSSAFSNDGGLTHYDIDEPGRPVRISTPHRS